MSCKVDECKPLPLGMHLAELPLEPQLGKALLVSGELECVEEMLTVAAYLQVQSVWASSRGRQKMLDEVKERFAVAEGRDQPPYSPPRHRYSC